MAPILQKERGADGDRRHPKSQSASVGASVVETTLPELEGLIVEGLGDPALRTAVRRKSKIRVRRAMLIRKIKLQIRLGERATTGHVACVISEEIVPKKCDHVAAPLSTESMD